VSPRSTSPRLQTGRPRPDDPAARSRHRAALSVLALLDAHLAIRTFFVAEQYTIADIAMYGYLHVAHEAGIDIGPYPKLKRCLEAVTAQPGHINDLVPPA
jgi:glutathione S-transferase